MTDNLSDRQDADLMFFQNGLLKAENERLQSVVDFNINLNMQGIEAGADMLLRAEAAEDRLKLAMAVVEAARGIWAARHAGGDPDRQTDYLLALEELRQALDAMKEDKP